MVIFFDIQKRHVDGFSKSFWKSNETLAAFLGLSDEAGDAILRTCSCHLAGGRRRRRPSSGRLMKAFGHSNITWMESNQIGKSMVIYIVYFILIFILAGP